MGLLSTKSVFDEMLERLLITNLMISVHYSNKGPHWYLPKNAILMMGQNIQLNCETRKIIRGLYH